jgi:hypothetical protein
MRSTGKRKRERKKREGQQSQKRGVTRTRMKRKGKAEGRRCGMKDVRRETRIVNVKQKDERSCSSWRWGCC